VTFQRNYLPSLTFLFQNEPLFFNLTKYSTSHSLAQDDKPYRRCKNVYTASAFIEHIHS
jgi:hypothetical protein